MMQYICSHYYNNNNNHFLPAASLSQNSSGLPLIKSMQWKQKDWRGKLASVVFIRHHQLLFA